jgi:hypothetical protein
MQCLRVEIVAFVDESFPGFVRCAFTDAEGTRHTFIEKVPVVTTEELWSDSTYPQSGAVACERVEMTQDTSGRPTAKITIDACDSLDSHRYDATYMVLQSQLKNC